MIKSQAWLWFLYKLFRLSFVAKITLVEPKSLHTLLWKLHGLLVYWAKLIIPYSLYTHISRKPIAHKYQFFWDISVPFTRVHLYWFSVLNLKISFHLQWLVLHVHGLVSFLSSLPLHNRMVVFQIYLQFKLQKRNLDPLVCKSCIKDSVILGIHVFSLGHP